MPPGLLRLAVAAVGGLALAIGLVALLNGRLTGLVLAVGAVALLGWSVFGHKVRG